MIIAEGDGGWQARAAFALPHGPAMFFALSKILGVFAIPSNLVIVLALLGAALVRTRFARAGWRLMVGGLRRVRGNSAACYVQLIPTSCRDPGRR